MRAVWSSVYQHSKRQIHLGSARRLTTESIQNKSVEKWDLYASVCVERKPQITKEMTPLEKKYITFLNEYELENSHKSDHEMRHLGDERLAEKIKSGEVDSGTIETAQDFEDKCNAELLTFLPMSRKTDADEKNDMKSLNRALDSHLLLVISQKIGSDYRWICPQMKVGPGQTLRQAANTILQEVCPDLNTKLMGNAPYGFYHYKYPRVLQNQEGGQAIGAKIFFYKANYIKGSMESKVKESSRPNPSNPVIEFKDYLWLKRDELNAMLHERYHKQITQFLIPEGHAYVNV